MKYTTLAFLLSLTLGGLTSSALATENDTQTAPIISSAQLQTLQWQTIHTGDTAEFDLSTAGQPLQQTHITGKVVALQLPADQGMLTIRVRSLIDNNQVFAPNMLVLDQHLQPAAFYTSKQFSYQPASLLTGDRLESTLKLAPAPGQKQIYLLIYTTEQDLKTQTTLEGAAKAYAQATGNQPPNIPDPQAKHSTQGHLNLKVSSERSSDAITIGSHMASDTNATPQPVQQQPAAAPAKVALLPDTENYFNQQIQKAIKQGNMAQAMTLVEEAERLGSTSARPTFISSIQPRK